MKKKALLFGIPGDGGPRFEIWDAENNDWGFDVLYIQYWNATTEEWE